MTRTERLEFEGSRGRWRPNAPRALARLLSVYHRRLREGLP